ncbi:DNA-formamidopyrimidine glycosylase, partial [bacterium]|nr:DNA-formamidopyrimidine glycosylase [bacterium]
MPELPEVETIRRDLAKKLVGKKVSKVKVAKKSKPAQPSPAVFIKNLSGKKITGINRRGKLLIFELSNNEFLLGHLKMTGQLIYKEPQGKIIGGGHPYPKPDVGAPNIYTRITINFHDGSNLFFNDQRLFGYMRVVDEAEKEKVLSRFGIEPLTKNFKLEDFHKIFKNRKVAVKAVLLDQPKIAGLGNIYVDEACFLAQIKPNKPANKLTKAQREKLFKAINKIIKE